MPISPMINQYMAQDQQAQAPQSAEAIFSQAFTAQANNALQAKYPALASLIVTFRILDSEVDKGRAFGVFVLRYGDEIRHLPVVMTNGMVKSCEMIYDRSSDTLFPLTEETVKDITMRANHTDHQLMQGDVKVEDTRGLFRDLIRPPKSSNVLLASTSMDVSALPNKAKDTLFNYFKGNPELLAKVAEFYPVESLAEKLAHRIEKTAGDAIIPEVLSVDTLTKEAAAFLSSEERRHMLDRGFLVKNAENEGVDTVVLNPDSQELLNLGLEEIGGEVDKECRDCVSIPTQLHSAEVLRITKKGFEYEPVLFTNKNVIFKNGAVRRLGCGDTAVVRNVRMLGTGDRDVLTGMGFRDKPEFSDRNCRCLHIATPARSGYTVVRKCLCGTITHFNDDKAGTESWTCDNEGITETDAIEYGSIENGGFLYVPKGSLYLDEDRVTAVNPYVRKISDVIRFMTRIGTHLSVSDDGVQVSVTDGSLGKTASFASQADAAAHLLNGYGLNAAQIDDVLSRRDSILLSKTSFCRDGEKYLSKVAYGEEAMGMPVNGQMMPYADPATMTGQVPARQPMMQSQAFDPQMVQDAAAMEDPEMLDVGMLASLAQEPDVKALLVDYLPDFISVLDKLGRVILLFNIEEQDMEEFYGKEKLGTLLGSCRRVFKTVGELVNDLKRLINMR